MASTIFTRMLLFAALLAVGAYAGKREIVDRAALDGTIQLTMRVLLPAMMFSLMYERTTREMLAADLSMIVVTAALYAALIALSAMMARALRLPADTAGPFRMTFVFGNTGFIGLPLLSAVLPNDGVVCLALFMVVDQLLLWTYGAKLAASGVGRSAGVEPRNFLNPNIVSMILAFVCVLLGFPLPQPLLDLLSCLAGAATPLCMLCLGALCLRGGTGAFRHRELYVGVALKMVAFPFAIGLLLRWLPLPASVVGAATLMAAMPATTIVPLIVKSKGGDDAYATGLTVATIAMGVVTIPLVAAVLGM